MTALILFALLLLIAVLSPFLGTATSEARAENARDDRGGWLAGPSQRPAPRF
jgi:hypothetical protein